jgi:streptogramin lyase
MRTLLRVSLIATGVANLAGFTATQVLQPGDLVVTNFQPPGLFRVDRAGVASAVPGSATALAGPAGVTTTLDGGAVVCDFNGNRLVRFAPDGTASVLAPGLGGPIRIATDHDGSFVVAAISPPQIVRVDANGNATPLASFASSRQRPFGIVVDRDRNIVFTTDLTPGVHHLDVVTNAITPLVTGQPLRLPQGVSLLPDGDYAVIDGLTDSVFRITRGANQITTWVSNAALAGNPEGIWPNDDGGFFIAQSASNNNRIALVDAAGAVGTFTQGAPFTNIEDCARIRELFGPVAPLTTGPSGQASLALDFGTGSATQLYSISLSTSAWPGLPLIFDSRSTTIAPDSLFLATFLRDAPPFFTGFVGFLDANGRANGSIDLRALPAGFLAGTTLFAQGFEFVTPGPYGGSDFGRFSNVVALRFQ